MEKNKINILSISFLLIIIFVVLGALNSNSLIRGSLVLAADNSNSKIYNDVIQDNLNKAAETGLPGSEGYQLTLLDRIAIFINRILGVLGIVFLVIIIVAGFKWMSSGGNQEEISQAKKMLVAGLVGIVIVFLAYAISAFVFNFIFSDYWRK